MFSKPLDRMRKTISFRLTLWYSGIFSLSSLVLFGFMYVLLSSHLEKKDREITRSRLREYVAHFQTGGIEGLKKDIRLEKHVDKHNSFFARIADRENNTLFLSVPEDVEELDEKHLKKLKVKEKQWVIMETEDDDEAIEMTSTVLPDGSLLQVGQSTEDRNELMERFREISAGIMIPVVLFASGAGALLAFRALRPIRHLVHTVRSIQVGKMNVRVPRGKSRDELNDLVILFNGMLEKIEALITGMRDTLDNVAHDLRTPMARLKGVAEMALQEEDDAQPLREALMDCAEESERILTMLNTLMDISEAETGVMKLEVEEVNIAGLIQDIIELYAYVAEDRSIAVHLSAPEDLYLAADLNRMRQVMANLLDNALKYTPAGGTIDIEARRKGRRIEIVVSDTGEGIPAVELPLIWDRLYRVDKSRSKRGLGLGLSLVRAVVLAHKGRIEVSSKPGKGSKFTLSLPV